MPNGPWAPARMWSYAKVRACSLLTLFPTESMHFLKLSADCATSGDPNQGFLGARRTRFAITVKGRSLESFTQTALLAGFQSARS
jgi:hypothetical protein